MVVTGIPGTGKTTLCKEVLKLAEESGRSVTVINYGSVMVELTKKQGIPLHRDELRKSNMSLQHDLQAEAAKIISQQAEEAEGTVIVDTHMSIKTLEGYWAGLPLHVLQILNPDAFVLVEAEPAEVFFRRPKDVTRRRDEVLENEIEEELLFSRLVAAACSVLTGAPTKIVKNPNGKQVEAAKETLKLME